MPTATEFTRTAQDQVFESVRQSQQAVVEAVRLWAKAVEKAVPAIPAVPFADELPRPEEALEGAFDFAEKLLAAQREFARNVLAAAAPVLGEKPANGSK